MLLQSFPTTWKDSLETFHQATTRPYGYLVLDLHPASSTTVVEPCVKRPRMDADVSKASQHSELARRGCPPPLCFLDWLGDSQETTRTESKVTGIASLLVLDLLGKNRGRLFPYHAFGWHGLPGHARGI